MNRRLQYLAIAATLAMTGCAIGPPKADAQTTAAANRPLLCKDKQQCDLYWSRAQAWVAQNSTYRIQTVTDTVISTYGPIHPKTDLAYQVIRAVNPDGSAHITIRWSCANAFGCNPDPATAAASFKRYAINGV